jgi:hypothetical protein
LYSYSSGRPTIATDPSGLAKIVGTTPPPPTRCVIYQQDAPGNTCWKQCDGGLRQVVPCPTLPTDDPEGPTYLTGIMSLRDGLDKLQAACESCALPGGCSPEQCKREAVDITFRLITAWQNNYGQGCHGSGRDPVGGHFCWDWSTIFDDAVRSGSYSCFKSIEGAATEDAGDYVHFFTIVYLQPREEACSVIFDDGYFHAATTSHSPFGYKRRGWTYARPATIIPAYPDCPHRPLGF